MSHLGELYQFIGGVRDGEVVAATVEPPFELRGKDGTYRTGVLVVGGWADDHVLIWEADYQPPEA